MPEKAPAPYIGYKVYRVFHKKEGRYFAVLVSRDHRTTIAYAKYSLEISLGRKLKLNHEAHHKDGDHTNDVIDNLEEIERPEHVKRHARGQTMISGVCLHCGQPFVRPKRNARAMKYCTRTCYGAAMKIEGRRPNNTSSCARGQKPVRHGTEVGYSHHRCRYDLCRAAHTARVKSYRERRAALVRGAAL